MKSFLKKKLSSFILNSKRQYQKRNKQFFSRRFLYNPHTPIEDLDLSTISAFKKILKIKSGAVIDIGANIGQTLNNILFIDEKIEYFGFEPQPYAAAILEIFIQENNLKNKSVIPIGLSDSFGIEDFYSFGEDFTNFYNTGATIKKSFIPVQKLRTYKRKVILEKGDDIIKKLKIDEIFLIKVDVEGAEFRVIEGLKKTIKEKRPFLIFEMLPFFRTNIDKNDFVNECLRLLKKIESYNMAIYSILESDKTNSNSGINLLSPDDITLENNIKDFIAVPNEFISEFKKYI